MFSLILYTVPLLSVLITNEDRTHSLEPSALLLAEPNGELLVECARTL